MNGIAFHGCPTRPHDAVGNVITHTSNAEEVAKTNQRRARLAALVGEHNVVIKTDKEVVERLARTPNTTADATYVLNSTYLSLHASIKFLLQRGIYARFAICAA